jgi:hypothetical protein
MSRVWTYIQAKIAALTDVSSWSSVLDEDDMSSDDATKVPTQQSVKAYVDSQAGGGAYSATFVDGDLTAGVLTVTHSLGSSNIIPGVRDNTGEFVQPDYTVVDSNTIDVDLSAFGTLTGTWTVTVLSDGGSTTVTHNNYVSPIQYILSPKAYENLSGEAGRWTLSGSGTDEYYLVLPIQQPQRVLYNNAAATQGTAGSLADHEWDWADNDARGYPTLYVRDTSGDPDGLTVGLWQADFWNLAETSYAGIVDGIARRAFSDSEDQAFGVRLPKVPTGATNLVCRFLAKKADHGSAATITFAARASWVADGEQYPQTTALTLSTATKSIGGAVETEVELVASLATAGIVAGDYVTVFFYRDVSEDAEATEIYFNDVSVGYE